MVDILLLIACYILGSLPFGYIITKVLGHTDIRAHGSGNIGATNVLRVLGWRAALPVFILDMAKGFIAVMLTRLISDTPHIFLVAAIVVLVGHSFPVFLKFKGGKAAATGIGVLLALSWPVTVILLVVAAVIIKTTKYVSLGSMISILLVPFLFWILNYGQQYIICGAAMAMLVVARHHSNIRRLLNGTESKLGQKAKI